MNGQGINAEAQRRRGVSADGACGAASVHDIGFLGGPLRLCASAVCLFVLAACGEEAPAQAPKRSGTFVAPAANTFPVEPPPKLAYVDVTREAGIDFVHENGAFGQKYLPETMGSGCAFFDYDGDSDPDLLLLNGDFWPGHEKPGARPTMRLYRNDGAWKFADVTADAGLAVTFYAMGCSAADVDADGDQDLFVSGVGGYRLYVNDGGKFRDATAASGLAPGTWKDDSGAEHGPFATSAAFFDYDADGRPDLFVCHYVHWSVATDIPSMLGKNRSYAIPRQYRGESCRLWRNLGGGKFEDATDAAGVRNDKGKSLGVAIADLGDDGRPDIAVANDTQPNYLYRNEGGRFTECGMKACVAYDRNGLARAGMGIDFAPVGPERKLCFAIGNFSGEPVSLYEETKGGGGVFFDRADPAGISLVTHPSLTFAVYFLDADLDGRADLLLANGHIEPTVQETQKDISYAQPTQLLRGLDGGRFADVTKLVGADLQRPRVARSIAYADADGDGDLDLCVTVNGGPAVLLRCDLENAAARSLRVRVHGKAPATDALGAKVTATVGGRPQTQWVRTGSGYLGQSELTLTFGLGDAGSASKIEVRWPDGSTKTYENVQHGVLDAKP